MKYLIFLLTVIACGHQEPPAQDLDDSDGDTIANAYEMDDDKYIAQYSSLEALKGTLTFGPVNQISKIDVAFDTKGNLEEQAYDLLTKRIDQITHEDFFYEFSKLHLNTDQIDKNLSTTQIYSLSLKIETTEIKPDRLFLVSKNAQKFLAKIEPSMNLTLSGEVLMDILKGKSYLRLLKPEHDVVKLARIKNNSYRIFRHDGEAFRLDYASKLYPFKSYLAKNGLSEARNIDDVSISRSHHDEIGWWFREAANGDKVVLYGKLARIKEIYLSGLQKSISTIERVNGINQPVVLLKSSILKPQRALIRVKQLGQTYRTFINQDKLHEWEIGAREGGYYYSCGYTTRFVSEESTTPIPEEVMLQNIKLSTNNQMLELSEVVKHFKSDVDKNGEFFWELGVEYTGEELSISLINPLGDNFDQVGVIFVSKECRKMERVETILVHREASFSLKVEAYLED